MAISRYYRPATAQSQVIVVSEFEPRECRLSKDAYRALRSRYAGQIDVTPTEQVGMYRLVGREYVGRIVLPGNSGLVIQPKVRVGNLFYMLCAQPDLVRFYYPPTRLAESEDLVALVLSELLSAVENLVARYGLYREYVPREDDLPFIRGRIALGPQLQHHADLKHRHICDYADFTPDTSENRVLAATLRYLPALLTSETDSQLARRTQHLLRLFGEMTAVNREEALAILPTINVHRLNASYAYVLGLCRLALQHLALSEQAGGHAFASFLVSMPRLFESFLTTRLKAVLPASDLRVVAQRSDYLDEDERVGIRPDVLVYGSLDPAPLLVLDAKYRRLDDPATDLNRDLYQVSAYMDRFGLQHGVLVYPQFQEASHSEVRVRGTSKRLHVTTLNLGASTPRLLDQECAALANRLVRWTVEDNQGSK